LAAKRPASAGSAAASPRSTLAAMRSALRGSCQMWGSGSPPWPWRSGTPWLVSTTWPWYPELLMVSSSHASRPTPFLSTTSARAMASMSAGDGS
jgi:hypothetical protein